MKRAMLAMSAILLSCLGGVDEGLINAARAQALTAREVHEENEVYSFDYSYPKAAAAIPTLRAMLDADLEQQRSELAEEAKGDKEEAATGGYTYHPYSRGIAWQVVTETPRWLSLSALVDTYTGGAHPNYWFDALLWDKVANRRRDALELFVSRQALSTAIRKQFCASLNRQREKKRGEPVNTSGDSMFGECLDPVEHVVILGSSNRKAFSRVGVLLAPYEAGPYVEGYYEVTLPVTKAVLAAVKPEFRSSFAVQR
jgi:Deacetylase PdaC